METLDQIGKRIDDLHEVLKPWKKEHVSLERIDCRFPKKTRDDLRALGSKLWALRDEILMLAYLG